MIIIIDDVKAATREDAAKFIAELLARRSNQPDFANQEIRTGAKMEGAVGALVWGNKIRTEDLP